MKVKDFQFFKYFLCSRNDIPKKILSELLELDVQILDGEKNKISKNKNTITYESPDSVMKFLYSTTMSLIEDFITDDIEKDKASLAIIHLCRDYVYLNYDKNKEDFPPVKIKFEQLPIPFFVINELISPLTGKIKKYDLIFNHCNYTDCCRYLPDKNAILINKNIRNNAAINAHVIFKTIELQFGYDSACKIIKSVLLNSDNLENLITISKFLNHDETMLFEFISILQTHAVLLPDEIEKLSDLKYNTFKKASDGKYTPQVFHQWSQMSMLMGLIEKQLGHMRGSFWPASEKIKPHEDKKRQFILKVTKEKGKNQLNLEELLETSRNWYNHNAIEPGQISEKLLKEERIWN